MSNAVKLFDQMRRNPRDWRIEDLRIVAGRFGLLIEQGKGSHVKFRHPAGRMFVVVPARRPVKDIYVRQLVKLIEEIQGST